MDRLLYAVFIACPSIWTQCRRSAEQRGDMKFSLPLACAQQAGLLCCSAQRCRLSLPAPSQAGCSGPESCRNSCASGTSLLYIHSASCNFPQLDACKNWRWHPSACSSAGLWPVQQQRYCIAFSWGFMDGE